MARVMSMACHIFVLRTAGERQRCDRTVSTPVMLKFVSEASRDHKMDFHDQSVCRAVLDVFAQGYDDTHTFSV